MNNGRELEQLVKTIQEALKDSPDTTIYSNAKLKNTSGRNREFDILIVSKLNGFNLKIAIECKDHKSRVSVDKIEAFDGKCKRNPEINKKVFVSTRGYQKDAINAAKEFGIELFRVEDIDRATILKWFPIKMLGLRFILKEYQFALIATEIELEKLNNSTTSYYLVINNIMIENIKAFLDNSIMENKDGIWNINLSEFMKNDSKTGMENAIRIPFRLLLQNAFVQNNEGLKFPVGAINASLDSWLIESDPDNIISKNFINNDTTTANYISVDTTKYGKVETVITSTKRKIFYTDNAGNKSELKQLGTYDPKTDKFTLSNPEIE